MTHRAFKLGIFAKPDGKSFAARFSHSLAPYGNGAGVHEPFRA